MKPFLIKFSLFVLPLLFLILGMEIFLSYQPSVFRTKVDYLQTNRDSIEVLVLGNSHCQSAINPKFLNFKTSNLAIGGQDLMIDKSLIENYSPVLLNLKYLLINISYSRLESIVGNNTRGNLFLRFHNINTFGRKTTFLDKSIFLSAPFSYFDFLNPYFEPDAMNEWGYLVKRGSAGIKLNRFENLNYDENIINSDTNNIFIKRHKKEDIENYQVNIEIYEDIIKLCLDNKITPILVITPVYKTYYEAMIPAKKRRRDDFVSYLINKYPLVKIFDQEYTQDYEIFDFRNEDHLNIRGGEKFSKNLNNFLLSIEKK